MSYRANRWADLAFRGLFSLIFIGAGLRHLVRPDEIGDRLTAAPLSYLATAVAPIPVLVIATGVLLLVAGVGLLLGVWPRLAAAALAAVLVPITITVDLGHTEALGPLFKNIALLGGLIHFMTYGADSPANEVTATRGAR